MANIRLPFSMLAGLIPAYAEIIMGKNFSAWTWAKYSSPNSEIMLVLRCNEDKYITFMTFPNSLMADMFIDGLEDEGDEKIECS